MADFTKVNYRSANGRMMFEIAGGSPKDIFEAIAGVQEVFEADASCGVCQSTDIQLRVREVSKGNKQFKFFELACQAANCRARLAYGQNTDMKNLFPKRADENGRPLPNRGWSRYTPQD